MTKEHVCREVRKLIDILNKYGNCLVPKIPGAKEPTSAKERLEWIVGQGKELHGMSIEDIEIGIQQLT